MIVVGLIGVLLGIVLPSLGRATRQAAEVLSLSNIRQIGAAIAMYTDANRGVVPTLYEPVLAFEDEGPPFQYETAWGGVPGYWFMQTGLYQLALDEPLPAEVVFAPQRADPNSAFEHLFQPTYFLADCFYAEPGYWDRFRQRGAAQWAPQALHRVLHPSAKGMMYQIARYDLPTPLNTASMACCTADLPPTAVLWSDLSGETLVIGSLTPGEPNFYHHSGPGYGSYNQPGPPILNTKDGVLGRDR